MGDPQIIVTTSWDDGHQLDARMAELLDEAGCSGTFYVSPRSREIPPDQRIQPSSLRDLSTRFEVGSHTLSHRHLTRIASDEAAREIAEGKQAVEDVLGQAVTSFCYPYGAYGPEHVAMVREAGFRVARTTRRFGASRSPDPLQMGTTTHAARYRRDALAIWRFTKSPTKVVRMWRDWDVLARHLLEDIYERGGVVHIWGHSWEIDENGDWGRLSAFLGDLLSHDGVRTLTNGELGELMRAEQQLS